MSIHNNNHSHLPAAAPTPIALVTGAGSGIGAAIAQRLSCRDGFHLVLVGRDPHKLSQTAKLLRTPHLQVPVDLTSPEAPQKISLALRDSPFQTKKISALINNAAIFHRLPFAQTTEAIWREEIETNLMSPVRLIQEFLPSMPSGSVIINVSSTLGIRPIANTVAYSAVKAALNNLTQGLALELAPHIRVCAVCPGLTDTPIHEFYQDDNTTSQARQMAHRAQPMGRMGRPEDIAAMVSFLVSPDSSWTTGSCHTVDGGISLL